MVLRGVFCRGRLRQRPALQNLLNFSAIGQDKITESTALGRRLKPFPYTLWAAVVRIARCRDKRDFPAVGIIDGVTGWLKRMALWCRGLNYPIIVMRPLASYSKAADATNARTRIVRPDKGQWILAYCARHGDVGDGTSGVASIRIVRTARRDVPVKDPRNASWIVATHLSAEVVGTHCQEQGAEKYDAVALSAWR